MTYGEIRTNFLSILNNTSCTDAMADAFIEQGMARSQRLLKLPTQEAIDEVSVTDGFEGIDLPNDLVRIINVYIYDIEGLNNGALDRISLTSYLEKAITTSTPKWYTRHRGQLLLNPTPLAGSTVKLLYYSEFNTFTDDDDETSLSMIAPDLFIYGGLIYAADRYLDERLPRFEDRYQQIVSELQNQADEDELSGAAVVRETYQFPYEDY